MTADLARARLAMLSGIKPMLKHGDFIFCTTDDARLVAELSCRSLATFREEEGTTLILARDDAAAHGFDVRMPMARIVLQLYSALDGVGLTAGVASALADEGIPCNMIAAYHHDHVFVPAEMAGRALDILQALERKSGSIGD